MTKTKTEIKYFETLENYMGLIKRISYDMVTKFPSSPLEREDYENNMMFELKKIVENYDSSRGKSFAGYITQCLNYSSINLARKYISKKHQIMNYAEFDTEWKMGTRNNEIDNTEIDSNYLSILTSKELAVLNKYLEGKKPEEASKDLGISKESYYSTKARAVQKLKKYKN